MAYLAQAGVTIDPSIHGIGGLADAAGISVKEVKAAVEAYCAGE